MLSCLMFLPKDVLYRLTSMARAPPLAVSFEASEDKLQLAKVEALYRSIERFPF